jgi:glyceraldehyde-3-phosphate dehydrogenase/erythrose-4-phosphate dehydrogenase
VPIQRSKVAKLLSTMVIDRTCVKVLAWYDNEAGYIHTLLEHVGEVVKKL